MFPVSYPGLGLDAQVQQDGDEGQRGDGGPPRKQIHVRASIGLERDRPREIETRRPRDGERERERKRKRKRKRKRRERERESYRITQSEMNIECVRPARQRGTEEGVVLVPCDKSFISNVVFCCIVHKL